MGKFDLRPEEMSKFHLTPAEAKGHSYAPPPSESKDDQALGLETGPMERTAFLPPLNDPQGGSPGAPFQRSVGPEAKRLNDLQLSEQGTEFLKHVAAQTAGGLGGVVSEGAMASPLMQAIVGKAGSGTARVMNAAAEGLHHGSTGGAIASHLLGHNPLLGLVLGALARPALRLGARMAPGAAEAAGAAVPGAVNAGMTAGAEMAPGPNMLLGLPPTPDFKR